MRKKVSQGRASIAIAERAGVNKAMLYYYVGAKKDLYREILTKNFDHVLTSVTRATQAATTPETRLRAFIEGLTRAAGEIEYHPQIMLREIASGGVNLEPEIVQRILEGMNLLVGILRDGVADERFRPTNPVMTHLTIVGAVVFMTSVAPLIDLFRDNAPPELKDVSPWSQSELGEHLFNLVTRGIETTKDPGDD